MATLGDYQFQAPRSDTPESGGGSRRLWIVIGAAILVAASVVAYLMFGSRTQPVAVQPAATEKPAAAQDRPLGGDAVINLPPLDDSDGLVRQLVGALSSHPSVAAWLATNGLIRNMAVVIENSSTGTTPSMHLRVLKPAGPFRVMVRGTALVIDPRSYDRYTSIADAVASIDAGAVAKVYGNLKPLIQMAYDELGRQEPVDRAVERTIVALLAVPAVDGDVRVEMAENRITYHFADLRLEALSGVQKQLLRMGPRNVRVVQNRLRLIALALGIPEQRLRAGSGAPA